MDPQNLSNLTMGNRIIIPTTVEGTGNLMRPCYSVYFYVIVATTLVTASWPLQGFGSARSAFRPERAFGLRLVSTSLDGEVQRRAGPSEWPSVAVPRAACWPKWPSEAVFLQRRAGPSGLAVLAQVFRRCVLGLCWIRPSCASCEAQTSCSGSNTIVTLTETLLCLRGGRETAISHSRPCSYSAGSHAPLSQQKNKKKKAAG